MLYQALTKVDPGAGKVLAGRNGTFCPKKAFSKRGAKKGQKVPKGDMEFLGHSHHSRLVLLRGLFPRGLDGQGGERTILVGLAN
jgi:hypothetical protein